MIQRKLAVVGNGSTAVNFLHSFLEKYEVSNATAPVKITIFGISSPKECGRGFAYRRNKFGNLTEAIDHADYTTKKGAFKAYAAATLGESADRSIPSIPRSLVGDFHVNRYEEFKAKAATLGVIFDYRQVWVTDITHHAGDYYIHAFDENYGPYDHIVIAVGDIRSNRFKQISHKLPAQVFETPYDLAEKILDDRRSDKVIVALGTRSSFVDFVNGFKREGYTGKIIGVSSTGITPWQGQDEWRPYCLQYLTEDNSFDTADEVFSALYRELVVARHKGAYIPSSLIKALSPTENKSDRLRWSFDLAEEAANADKMNYHVIALSVDWEKIYCNLRDDLERQILSSVLSDFILYNRVNINVREDYRAFIKHIHYGDVEIKRDSFGADSIQPKANGRLAITLNGDASIEADYVVNCAIGPAPAYEQAETHELLTNCVRKGWLKPRDGTGFDVSKNHAISLLGAQARLYPFSSLGLETYGIQIEKLSTFLIERLPVPIGTADFRRDQRRGKPDQTQGGPDV